MGKEYADRQDRPLRDGVRPLLAPIREVEPDTTVPRCPNQGSMCNCTGACLPHGYAMGTLSHINGTVANG